MNLFLFPFDFDFIFALCLSTEMWHFIAEGARAGASRVSGGDGASTERAGG